MAGIGKQSAYSWKFSITFGKTKQSCFAFFEHCCPGSDRGLVTGSVCGSMMEPGFCTGLAGGSTMEPEQFYLLRLWLHDGASKFRPTCSIAAAQTVNHLERRSGTDKKMAHDVA